MAKFKVASIALILLIVALLGVFIAKPELVLDKKTTVAQDAKKPPEQKPAQESVQKPVQESDAEILKKMEVKLRAQLAKYGEEVLKNPVAEVCVKMNTDSIATSAPKISEDNRKLGARAACACLMSQLQDTPEFETAKKYALDHKEAVAVMEAFRTVPDFQSRIAPCL